mgnify:CR=1 FL=1
MNTMVGCPIPGASQPKEPVRLVDANSILRLVNMDGCAYDGSEYQAYKAGVEYVRGLIEDAPTIDPETLRHTAHWVNEDSFYKDSIVRHCSACKSKFVLRGGTPENDNYKYCPCCGKRIVDDDE